MPTPSKCDNALQQRPRLRRRATVPVTGLALVLALGAMSAATAQIVSDPLGRAEIGTTPDDHPGHNGNSPWIAVANGGCAYGLVAVGTGGCAPDGLVSVGLGGSGASGNITVADRGDSSGYSGGPLLPIPPGISVTGGGGQAGCGLVAVNAGDGRACATGLAVANDGFAYGANVAVANKGNASGGKASVSVMGTAGHEGEEYNDGSSPCSSSSVSVSLTGDACTYDGIAVAPNGDAWRTSGSGTAVGSGHYKRTVANGAEGVGGTTTYIHTGLNKVEDAYQAALVATAPPPDPLQVAQKYAWANDALPCVTALLAMNALTPPPDMSGPPPSGSADCLVDDLSAPSSPSAARQSSSAHTAPWDYPQWGHFFAIHLEPGYPDGCLPQMAKAMYGSYGMPSQKRLYNEMGTKRAGGTTFPTGVAVIRKYFQGPSMPIADTVGDPDTLMARIASLLTHAYQPTILGVQPGISHWPGHDTEDAEAYYGDHVVGTWGYDTFSGGGLFLVDGFNNPYWGDDNPYGIGNYVKLPKLFAAMTRLGRRDAEMIW